MAITKLNTTKSVLKSLPKKNISIVKIKSINKSLSNNNVLKSLPKNNIIKIKSVSKNANKKVLLKKLIK